jgi:hypothetical protein
VAWNGNFGNFFGDRFASVPDPQCSDDADNLKSLCTLKAVTDAKSGQIVLQNPLPARSASSRPIFGSCSKCSGGP